MKRSLFKKHQLWYVAGFLIINLAACIIIGNHAYRYTIGVRQEGRYHE